MIVTHEHPVGWVDTGEVGFIQPSEVSGLVHVVTLEGEDIEILRGPAGEVGAAGAQGVKGDTGAAGAVGAAGAQGVKGDTGAAGAVGAAGAQGIKGDTGAAGAKGVAPAGAVLHFAMAAAPAGWLVCDGGLVSRAAYASLFAAIGALYGAGDGATTFKLPDLRGEFLRGADGGRGVDAGRVLGSAQGFATQDHRHFVSPAGEVLIDTSGAFGVAGGLSYKSRGVGVWAGSKTSSIDTFSGGVPDAETRPRNIALLPCISTGL